MKNHCLRFLSLSLVLLFTVSEVQAAWVWSPTEGKFVSPQTTTIDKSQKTAEETFQTALKLRGQKSKENDYFRLLRHVVKEYPQSVHAPEAQFLIASLLEEKEKFIRAVGEFKKVVREYPRSPRVEDAIEHLYQIGNFFLTGEKQKLMGVAIIPVYSKAVDVYKFIVEQAPYGIYGDQSQLRLGQAYRKMMNYDEAVAAFQALLTNYPASPLIDEANYQLAETSYERSQNANQDQTATTQASAHLKDFIRQYSSSSLTERAKLLKQQLDEQDAEKNYRIGLYYEKQGAVESALIYYEDVAERHSETKFGAKAANRLKVLKEPIEAMEKGEAAVQQRIAEVRSMLEALEQQEKKEGDQKVVSETVDLRKQLKEELTSLVLGQKELSNESRTNFNVRRKALRANQKNLRSKFKTFKHRQKELSKNPSPELEEVLQRWHGSLIAEEEELVRERQSLLAIKRELLQQGKPLKVQKEGRRWGFYRTKQAALEPVRFEQKKWNQYQKERDHLIKSRRQREDERRDIEVRLKDIELQAFQFLKEIPQLEELFPQQLHQLKTKLNQQKKELDQATERFEQTKKEFEAKFGQDFIKNLASDSDFDRLAAVNSLLASGNDLNQVLTGLQSEQSSVSERWLVEKEKWTTIANALGTNQNPAGEEQLTLEESAETTSQAKQSRLLKKRMKYLEREIRSRVDQIQDWQRENAKRMKQLSHLLKPEGQSTVEKAASKMLGPAKGTYKLTRAFFFGLENKDQKLMEQAAVEAEGQGSASDERQIEIRQLREEIELQSILIQGRVSEIEGFQGRLNALKKESQTIPGFSYKSLLVERVPTDLAHTISTAKKLILLEGDSDIQKRLDTKTKEVAQMEQKMNDLADQIEIVQLAIQQKNDQTSKPSKLQISVSGDTEQMPQEENSEADQRNQAQSQLIQLKAEVNIRQSSYQLSETEYLQQVLHWYQTVGREKVDPKIAEKGSKIFSQKSEFEERKSNLQKLQAELLKKEKTIVESQKNLTDQKLTELEAQLEELKNPSEASYTVLMSEIKETQKLRDSLTRDLTTLQTS